MKFNGIANIDTSKTSRTTASKKQRRRKHTNSVEEFLSRHPQTEVNTSDWNHVTPSNASSSTSGRKQYQNEAIQVDSKWDFGIPITSSRDDEILNDSTIIKPKIAINESEISRYSGGVEICCREPETQKQVPRRVCCTVKGDYSDARSPSGKKQRVQSDSYNERSNGVGASRSRQKEQSIYSNERGRPERVSERDFERDSERDSDRDSDRDSKRGVKRSSTRRRDSEEDFDRDYDRDSKRGVKRSSRRDSEEDFDRDSDRDSKRGVKRSSRRDSEEDFDRDSDRDSKRGVKRNSRRYSEEDFDRYASERDSSGRNRSRRKDRKEYGENRSSEQDPSSDRVVKDPDQSEEDQLSAKPSVYADPSEEEIRNLKPSRKANEKLYEDTKPVYSRRDHSESVPSLSNCNLKTTKATSTIVVPNELYCELQKIKALNKKPKKKSSKYKTKKRLSKDSIKDEKVKNKDEKNNYESEEEIPKKLNTNDPYEDEGPKKFKNQYSSTDYDGVDDEIPKKSKKRASKESYAERIVADNDNYEEERPKKLKTKYSDNDYDVVDDEIPKKSKKRASKESYAERIVPDNDYYEEERPKKLRTKYSENDYDVVDDEIPKKSKKRASKDSYAERIVADNDYYDEERPKKLKTKYSDNDYDVVDDEVPEKSKKRVSKESYAERIVADNDYYEEERPKKLKTKYSDNDYDVVDDEVPEKSKKRVSKESYVETIESKKPPKTQTKPKNVQVVEKSVKDENCDNGFQDYPPINKLSSFVVPNPFYNEILCNKSEKGKKLNASSSVTVNKRYGEIHKGQLHSKGLQTQPSATQQSLVSEDGVLIEDTEYVPPRKSYPDSRGDSRPKVRKPIEYQEISENGSENEEYEKPRKQRRSQEEDIRRSTSDREDRPTGRQEQDIRGSTSDREDRPTGRQSQDIRESISGREDRPTGRQEQDIRRSTSDREDRPTGRQEQDIRRSTSDREDRPTGRQSQDIRESTSDRRYRTTGRQELDTRKSTSDRKDRPTGKQEQDIRKSTSDRNGRRSSTQQNIRKPEIQKQENQKPVKSRREVCCTIDEKDIEKSVNSPKEVCCTIQEKDIEEPINSPKEVCCTIQEEEIEKPINSPKEVCCTIQENVIEKPVNAPKEVCCTIEEKVIEKPVNSPKEVCCTIQAQDIEEPVNSPKEVCCTIPEDIEKPINSAKEVCCTIQEKDIEKSVNSPKEVCCTIQEKDIRKAKHSPKEQEKDIRKTNNRNRDETQEKLTRRSLRRDRADEDPPALGSLIKPNIVEDLKRELINAFARASACQPATVECCVRPSKFYQDDSDCYPKTPTNNNCCCSVSIERRSSPRNDRSYERGSSPTRGCCCSKSPSPKRPPKKSCCILYSPVRSPTPCVPLKIICKSSHEKARKSKKASSPAESSVVPLLPVSEEHLNECIIDDIIKTNCEEEENCRDALEESSFLCCCCRCCNSSQPSRNNDQSKVYYQAEESDCSQEDSTEDQEIEISKASTLYQGPLHGYSSDSLVIINSTTTVIAAPGRSDYNNTAPNRLDLSSQVRLVLSTAILHTIAESDTSQKVSPARTSPITCCVDVLPCSPTESDHLQHRTSPTNECPGYIDCNALKSLPPVKFSSPNSCCCPCSCSYPSHLSPRNVAAEVAANARAAAHPTPKPPVYLQHCRCGCTKRKQTQDQEVAKPSVICYNIISNNSSDFNYPTNIKLVEHCSDSKSGSMSSANESEESSVRVAVRVRPQNPREVIDMCRICTTVTPGEPHVVLGQDKAFTFDYVFDINVGQSEVYGPCVERLVEGALRGYNATVLAYGQTGSGKTFTMGTGFEHDLNEQQQGIIPRAVRHIFSGIENMQTQEYDENGAASTGNIHFSVAAQFMELYNEDIIDLLDPYNKGRVYKIHEDASGQITVNGATIKPLSGPQDALKCLQQGALARTTASTQMNDQSSRSHALFTILIRRQRVLTAEESGMPGDDLETLTSKFHFVDLAGSERLKRTGATGERAREGISINCGLLALGNCISALGDKSKRATHIPYRDSKLTRLLQDSLGGNSQTLMIACVSPCDRDFMETLNTLKYANRARNIKNKVQLNQDQSSRTISQLRREIAALQMELLEYKQGKRLIDGEGNSSISDTFHENAMLLADNKRLQQRLKAMQETINSLTESNVSLKLEKVTHGWSSLSDSSDRSVTNMIAGYISEIEKLQAKLIESEEMYQQLKKGSAAGVGNLSHRGANRNNGSGDNPDELINLAKRVVEKDREMLMSRSLPGLQDDANNLNNSNSIGVPSNESCDSDSDTESDDKTIEMQADLNDINSDIEIKSKLIEQLELSQQRMQVMRQHYEEKLSVLNCKIINTQKERDEVLANIGPSAANQPSDKVKKVKDEYERKLNDMQREMKKLQQAQREHIRQQRELQAQEAKLRNLRTELAELKCIKTRLIRKMTEQTHRHKEVETRKAREIATLRKEQRRQQNAVKSLQAQMYAKEQILKRKTEEVSALRRSQRGTVLSQKAAGRVPPAKSNVQKFNTRQAHQRWDKLSRVISRASRNKQAVLQLEKELERLMSERETLCHDLATVQKRQRVDLCIELANEEDTIHSNLNYVQENIAQVQHAIMDFEEGKEASTDLQSLQFIIGNVRNVDEARFLLEHLTNTAIMFSCNSALTQNRLSEHESLLKEMQQESGIQQQLLQHFLSQNNSVQISDLFASLKLDSKLNANNLSGSQKSLNSNGTYDIPADGDLTGSFTLPQTSISRSPSPTPGTDSLSHDRNAKVRRRTAQPQDLLFGDSEISHNGLDPMTRSYTQQETSSRNVHPLMRVPSAPGSLKESLNSPSLTKKNMESSLMGPTTTQPQSPRFPRRGMPNKGSPGFDDDVMMVPQSPPVYRKMISREEGSSNNSNGGSDVFSRLGAGQQDPAPGGSIQKVTGKIRVGAPLYCTHTVSGHNNSVLSIKVEEDTLYTAAADRTVKVWDLSRETAQHCLSTHPGPVIAVQNDKATRLLFSASGPYVRVWDLRSSNTKPIKTLTSSGQVLAGTASTTGITPGESPVTALCMGTSGNLYVAASDKVRIWDLNNLACVGKLSGGHQAAVMCVTAWHGDGDGNTDFVATGSKDHYVKVFEVPRAGGVVYPLLNLEPPHYDGVQALAVAKDAVGADAELFSGSRDSGIKRWDLKSGELKQSLNNAHKGWVSGMAISADVLLSSCRGGIIRLWNVKSCESLAEMKTDLLINDIVASGQRVFTASSDGKVRLWRFTNTLRRQCSLDSNSS